MEEDVSTPLDLSSVNGRPLESEDRRHEPASRPAAPEESVWKLLASQQPDTGLGLLDSLNHFSPQHKACSRLPRPPNPTSPSAGTVFPGLLTEACGFQLRSFTQEVVHCLESSLTEAPRRPPRAAVFDEPVDVMLSSVLAGGHLEDVGYAQEGLQGVPVSHHLRNQEEAKGTAQSHPAMFRI
ncbi:hypothetical protein EYF80_059343 [Liparis tanakae]|uniref:Uncharacterized protein n=1 Tax=Liparis tanakae TaxID=230148 RepID=A0A4Z2ENM9_9TELE|nr:hypothetical protein EYF80_059343 [Liparis tanakae]